MRKYVITTSSITDGNILRLVIKPKHPRDRLEYQPGQYAAIGFKRSGRPSPMRCFSLVSSPYGTDELEFAIRVQGAFTQSLAELQPGSGVRIQGPYGNFTIDAHYDSNMIMLAGGIGVTPFMSMIRASTSAGLPNRLFLLYSNPRHDEIPFRDELLDHERRNPQFGSVFFVTKDSDLADRWPGQRIVNGRISEKHLSQLTGGKLSSCTYFICGPKAFIKNYQKLLTKNGVSRDRIVTEAFSTDASLTSAILPRDRNMRLTYALATVAIVAGTTLIGALDLVRYVPAKMQADALVTHTHNSVTTSAKSQPQSTPAPSTTPPADQTTPTTPAPVTAPVPSTSSAPAPTSSTAPAQTTTPAPAATQPSTPAPTQTYQPPVSSVS